MKYLKILFFFAFTVSLHAAEELDQIHRSSAYQSLKGITEVRLDKAQPLKTSQTFTMNPIAMSDVPEITQSIFGDPEVVRTWEYGGIADPEAYTKRRVKAWVERLEVSPCSWRTIRLDSDHSLVGMMGSYLHQPEGEIEFVYLMSRSYWNQGFGTAAARANLKYFASLEEPFNKVFATARHDNPHSWQILERVGFSRIGDTKFEGAEVPRYRYEITADKLKTLYSTH